VSVDPRRFEALLRAALDEDLAAAGDLTTEAVVDRSVRATADLVARRTGTVAGLPLAAHVVRLVEPGTSVTLGAEDGQPVNAGTVLAVVEGPARGVLTAERTALNLLGHLSGVATATADLVARVAGTGARIADTRKTTPGLRALEKYAVRMGGGMNHRFGLYDAVMVKDNHLVAAGGIGPAVERVRARVGHMVTVEVEVTSLAELAELLQVAGRHRVDVVLLDNMDASTLRRAVELVGGVMVTEASGGITAETVREVAETGVDVISVGWITHSAPTLDVALDFR
jgi:nicotinate-nucleotide pyrophosphorylase (carboxylating)